MISSISTNLSPLTVTESSSMLISMEKQNETQSSTKTVSRLKPLRPLVSAPKYQPILPKRTLHQEHNVSKRIYAKPGLFRRACRVAACRRDDCNLQSHCLYNARRHTSCQETSSYNCANQCDSVTVKDISKAKHKYDLSILDGGVDGLPPLPLGGMEESTFRQMFHHFFVREYHIIDRIMKPPPSDEVERQEAVRAKHRMVEVALSEPVFCLHLISAVHHQIVLQDNSNYITKTTRNLHNKIMALLREKLDNFQATEITDLVLVILTLVQFEIAASRIDSLDVHRRAVDHLVSSQGGVHNMGCMIPYVYTLDRLLALFTDTRPRYAPRIDGGIRRPSQFAHIYGEYFESKDMKNVDKVVTKYCFDACRAIETLERSGLTFDLDTPVPKNSSNFHYFFFLKECLINDFAYINAEMASRQDAARCTVIAAKIVDYVVLQHNYVCALTQRLVNTLCDILYKQDIDQVWAESRSVLRWILFVMICVPNSWGQRELTKRFLKQELNREYCGMSWPKSWREIELDNVRKFVWSDSRFNQKFCKSCDEIVNDVGSII